MRIASLYVLFAALATAVNLAVQWLVLRQGQEQLRVLAALVLGTVIAMPLKFFLDSRWIFHHRVASARRGVQQFVLYTVMAGATTLIFWASELAIGAANPTVEGHLIGGAVGLALGYQVKYLLDRKFVFVPERTDA